MIKKIAVLLAAATTLFVTGCSSYPDSANGVAKAVCGAFKAGDLEGAKSYMDATALQKTADSERVLSKFFALPEFQEEAARLDCSKPSKTQVIADYQKVIYFEGSNVEVQVVDGNWKLIV